MMDKLIYIKNLLGVGSHIRHYCQNGGTTLAPSPHSTGTDPG